MDIKQAGSGAVFALGMLCIGFTTGGVVGGRLLSRGGMGWDRLANMLGGVSIGMIAAVVVTGATVTRLTPRQRLITGGVCFVIAVLLIAVMQQTTGPSP